ncbi:CIA30 family protein [Lutimonas zeaxanthinifaciens]|uniref:CIA30 family protein n=1 Tax=Lutimonas zeaxanthinifaciens TaxID=3060215 RepID=UPI00265D3211|nr:CIA30 family protein [Lutimonas sp. YSD2104]WKK64610.1 CIA30 family protein [Lutimonas sp. YSD2104]
MQDHKNLFDFSEENASKGWFIINDGVMGGLSKGSFSIDDQSAVFRGNVSTENNGGFTMVANRFEAKSVDQFNKFRLKLKGDGKNYQFRVKSDSGQQYSYVAEFSTNGEWQEILIPFNSMEPRFRGRLLDRPNFEGIRLQEVAFLIGNKKMESFELIISKISIE